MSGRPTAVRAFVADQVAVPLDDIHPHTSIQIDLGVDGDDAVDFLEAFSEKFSVDLTGLDWNRHFGTDATGAALGLLPVFLLESLLFLAGVVPSHHLGSADLEPIRVADLIRAARRGIWLTRPTT